jgi:hypothetical protein
VDQLDDAAGLVAETLDAKVGGGAHDDARRLGHGHEYVGERVRDVGDENDRDARPRDLAGLDVEVLDDPGDGRRERALFDVNVADLEDLGRLRDAGRGSAELFGARAVAQRAQALLSAGTGGRRGGELRLERLEPRGCTRPLREETALARELRARLGLADAG